MILEILHVLCQVLSWPQAFLILDEKIGITLITISNSQFSRIKLFLLNLGFFYTKITTTNRKFSCINNRIYQTWFSKPGKIFPRMRQ